MEKLLFTLFIMTHLTYGFVCKDDHRVLDKGGFTEHFLSFTNFGHLFKGRCRGHTLITQRSYFLMEFNTGENPYQCSPEKMDEDCKKFYYDKIANVFFRNQVEEIPGFKNLKEFTDISYIKGLFKYHVSQISNKFKTRMVEVEHRDENKSINHFFAALKRVEKNELPYIAISSPEIGNHAVLGHKIQTNEFGRVICVRDPNLIPDLSKDCENFFYFKEVETIIPATIEGEEDIIQLSNEVFYKRRKYEQDKKVNKLRVYREQDKRVEEYIQSRYEYCQKQID